MFVHLNGGSVRTQLTNTDTGETISRNASGPEMDVYYPDGSASFTFPGPSLFWSTGIEGLHAIRFARARASELGSDDPVVVVAGLSQSGGVAPPRRPVRCHARGTLG